MHDITSKISNLLKLSLSFDLRDWRRCIECVTGIVTLSVLMLWIAVDLWWDYSSSASLSHILADALFALLAILGVLQLGGLLLKARYRTRTLQNDLAFANESVKKSRGETRQILQGLGETIHDQFTEWKLSASEREVGLLLLKGLSIKEIATVRETSERTARHQALAIYEKAGVAGRAELSAFFLEDLMLPMQGSSVPPETERTH